MALTLAQMLALLPDNTAGDISAEDMRDIVTALHERDFDPGRPQASGVETWVIPGIAVGSITVGTNTINEVRYEPFFVHSEITIDRLAVEVTSSVGSSTLRIGVYEADVDLQPGALVVEGAVSSASNAVVTLTVNELLMPGRYLAAVNSSHSSIQTRRFVASNGPASFVSGLGANAMVAKISKSLTYAALGDPGTPWDTLTSLSTGMQHQVVMRVT